MPADCSSTRSRSPRPSARRPTSSPASTARSRSPARCSTTSARPRPTTTIPLAIELTDAGRLEGEIPRGYYRVRREIEEIEGFDPHLAQAILHIILSHHGQLEHGSPVVPATREATLVHSIDNLGGKLGSFDRLEKELADGESWSRFDRGIDGSAFFGSRPPSRVSPKIRSTENDPLAGRRQSAPIPGGPIDYGGANPTARRDHSMFSRARQVDRRRDRSARPRRLAAPESRSPNTTTITTTIITTASPSTTAGTTIPTTTAGPATATAASSRLAGSRPWSPRSLSRARRRSPPAAAPRTATRSRARPRRRARQRSPGSIRRDLAVGLEHPRSALGRGDASRTRPDGG